MTAGLRIGITGLCIIDDTRRQWWGPCSLSTSCVSWGTLPGIEAMYAIRKGQLINTGAIHPTPADQFHSLPSVTGVQVHESDTLLNLF